MMTRLSSILAGVLGVCLCVAGPYAVTTHAFAAPNVPSGESQETPEATPPAGLSVAAWNKLLRQIREAQYDLTRAEEATPENCVPIERTARENSLATWVASNRPHGLEVSFDNNTIRFAPIGAAATCWDWAMSLVGYGRPGEIRRVSPAEVVVEGNRMEYRRGDLTEWYVNDRRGVEQGFTVLAPPPGQSPGRLVVELDLSGTLSPSVNGQDDSMLLRDADGVTRLHYGGLHAFDAEGRELPARLTLRDAVSGDEAHRLAILVDTTDAVYPLTIDPVITSEVAKLTASDAAASDRFGGAVAISGNMVVVGAPWHEDAAYLSGSAYLFGRNHGGADSWGEVKKLTASDAAAYAYFGDSVAISGDTVVVGASGDDGAAYGAGAAYVFKRNHGGADNWGEVKKLTASDTGEREYFGFAVAIDGDTVVVGTAHAISGGPNYGAAYVFERNQGGADNWGEVRKLIASDAVSGHEFGKYVAISGDMAVVGAYRDYHAGTSSGAAYLYGRNHGGVDNWGEVKKLTASDASANSNFGRPVAISGSMVVVGAGYEDGLGPNSNSGAAYLFERNHGGGDNWGEVKKLTASDADQNEHFGLYVAISGDTVVAGAPDDDEAGNHAGSAYLFMRNQGGAENWGEVKKLTASDADQNEHFGVVAISGNVMVVGAALDDHDGGEDAGSAYVFSFVPDCGWIELAKPAATDAAASDYFGSAVAISGDRVLVGAYQDDDAGSRSGSAYLFERNQGGANSWGQVTKLTASDAAFDDQFGRFVAISGDTVVVGSFQDDDAGSKSGSAYLFERNQGGADSWGEVKKLTASDAAASDEFGLAVAMSGDTVIVGAHLDDDAGSGSGSAYLFGRNQGGADNWGQVKKITALDAAANDRFGRAVAISGDTVVVGAYVDDDAGTSSGSAYVFERNQGGADNWGQVRKLTASDAAANDYFGYAVAISSDTVVVGAYANADAGLFTGSAYVFERNQGGADNWGEVRKLVVSDAAASDYFGLSVANSGDMVVVGAYLDDDAYENSGSIYLFGRNHGGMDNWGEFTKLTASDAAAGDYFGLSVAISGDKLVAGAYRDDDAGTDSGSAYVLVGVGAEEVRGLGAEGASPTTLSWIDNGAGIVYDVAGGLVSDLRPAHGVDGAVCLEEDAPTSSHVDWRSDPPPGDAYYYMVREQHGCSGSYGYGRSGNEQTERIPAAACD